MQRIVLGVLYYRNDPAMIGVTLNQYRITAAIGAGGMGEVFRARDTRLNLDVAVTIAFTDTDTDRNLLSGRFAVQDFGEYLAIL